MNLALLLSTVTLVVAGLTLLLVLRRSEQANLLRKLLQEEALRQRQDLQLQLQPLSVELKALGRELALAKDQQLRAQAETLAQRFEQLNGGLQSALDRSRLELDRRLEGVQGQVQARLTELQASNEAKLEQMRRTVDEQLHATLEQRLGESFRRVSESLERVQHGLGEMRSLAQDVGGLKRALTNVKTRGVLGEAQLGALLEQYLAPGQYAANVKVRPRAEVLVEYAVKLPGAQEGETVWLPIDAKFSLEDYQRLMEAYEAGDAAEVQECGRALEARLLSQAREIRDKYLAPPHTTSFALLFLPFEGLYAEALRRPGLLERLQRDCGVTIVGPTTLAAFLNSLQIGFKTLAISRSSSEVWKVLGAVKTEFRKFGDAVGAVNRKLEAASREMAQVAERSRLMERRLHKVEELPEAEARSALGLLEDGGTDDREGRSTLLGNF